MKTKQHIFKTIIMIFISLVAIGAVSYYTVLKSEYQNKFSYIQHKKDNTYLFPDDWAFDKGRCPDNIDSVFSRFSGDKEIANDYMTQAMQDPFQKEGHLKYIPIYNRERKLAEAYMLISAGYDGIMNTKYTYGDTIYLDQVNSKFNFYNKIRDDNIVRTDTMEFSLFQTLFGAKDYLVMFMNTYKSQIRVFKDDAFICGDKNFKRFNKFIYNENHSRKTKIKGIVIDKKKGKDKYRITLMANSCTIICSFYEYYNFTTQKLDSTFIVGRLYRANQKQDTLYLKSCVQVSRHHKYTPNSFRKY